MNGAMSEICCWLLDGKERLSFDNPDGGTMQPAKLEWRESTAGVLSACAGKIVAR